MPIDVICDGCDKRFRLKDELAGKRFKCKGCGKVLTATPAGTDRPSKAPPKSAASPRQSESSASAPRPPKRRPKPRPAPIADPFEDDYDKPDKEDAFGGVDDYGDDYGDDLGDDYAAPPPKKRKKKKATAKSKGFKKSKKQSSGGGLPAMTFNLHRLNAGLVIVGCILIFAGIKEFRVSAGTSSTAKEVSLETLYAEGAGEDVYLTITGAEPVTDFYVATESRLGRMSEIWYACAPANERNRPKFVLYSTDAHTEAEVAQLMSRSTHTGMLISNVSGLDSETKGLFRENVPGINVDSPIIFQVGRAPSSFLVWVGMILGGLLLALGGLFWIFFVHE